MNLMGKVTFYTIYMDHVFPGKYVFLNSNSVTGSDEC